MNVLIVEDERLVALSLQHLLRTFGFEADDIAETYDEAVEILTSKTIHLAFLDINLSGKLTGIDVANYVRDHVKIPFIYLTSLQDMHILNAALGTVPQAILTKPFQSVSIYSAINLAIREYNHAEPEEQAAEEPEGSASGNENEATVIKDMLFIKEKDTFVKILLDEILFIRSDDNYVELHTAQKKLVIRETMKGIMRQLPTEIFCRVHKSYIINLNAVTALNNLYVIIGKTRIPISGGYRDALFNRLKTFS